MGLVRRGLRRRDTLSLHLSSHLSLPNSLRSVLQEDEAVVAHLCHHFVTFEVLHGPVDQLTVDCLVTVHCDCLHGLSSQLVVTAVSLAQTFTTDSQVLTIAIHDLLEE